MDRRLGRLELAAGWADAAAAADHRAVEAGARGAAARQDLPAAAAPAQLDRVLRQVEGDGAHPLAVGAARRARLRGGQQAAGAAYLRALQAVESGQTEWRRGSSARRRARRAARRRPSEDEPTTPTSTTSSASSGCSRRPGPPARLPRQVARAAVRLVHVGERADARARADGDPPLPRARDAADGAGAPRDGAGDAAAAHQLPQDCDVARVQGRPRAALVPARGAQLAALLVVRAAVGDARRRDGSREDDPVGVGAPPHLARGGDPRAVPRPRAALDALALAARVRGVDWR